jgi:hypothetical protein
VRTADVHCTARSQLGWRGGLGSKRGGHGRGVAARGIWGGVYGCGGVEVRVGVAKEMEGGLMDGRGRDQVGGNQAGS